MSNRLYPFLFAIIAFVTLHVNAQDKKSLDRLDSTIIHDIINPAQQQAQQNNETLDWDTLRKQITQKYSAEEADRAITKATIYSSWGRDWPTFTAAIVHYTDAYEDKDDLPLMNKNANFILKYSQNKDEWKKASRWISHAVDKDPSNTAYKATYDALQAKINGQ